MLDKVERDGRNETESIDPEAWEKKSNFDESWEEKAAWEAFDRFIVETLAVDRLPLFVAAMNHGSLRYDCGRLHLLTAGLQVPVGLCKVKTGLFLGQIRRLRGQRVVFEPSHAFLLSLTAPDFSRTASGSSDSDLIRRYLRGDHHRPGGWDVGARLSWCCTAQTWGMPLAAGLDQNHAGQPDEKFIPTSLAPANIGEVIGYGGRFGNRQ